MIYFKGSIMKAKEKLEAIRLRKWGYSLNEIVERVGVSKSTISLWVRNIALSDTARQRINERLSNGQLASIQTKKVQTQAKEQKAALDARKALKTLHFDVNTNKLLCAMIYFCEGTKSSGDVRFTNSDPGLIKLFLSLFRSSFDIDEKKLSVCVHLHSYHQKEEQLKFWSKTSNIPVRQFIKPYQKKHSGLYKKEGYQGCVCIRYGSAVIARELKAIALEFIKKGL